jgi:DNA modification methylase
MDTKLRKNTMGNRLILGDNLQVLKNIPSESVDLCYIDPPFFSNRNYEVIWGDEGEVASFRDRWSGGIDHYIGWLKERIEEIWRVLKPNGNLCVHCDWHANAYIRVYILDRLGAGEGCFINEIIWCYNVGGKSKRSFARKHDLIFWYAKGKDYFFDGKSVGIKRETGDKSFGGKMGVDENGRRYQDKLAKSSGKRYRYYLDDPKIPEDWWVDINSIQSQSGERIGYPTQKPLALLDRIIKASSNEGDVVLDAFCGGGTTLVAAQRLKRKFIGIDQSVRAITVSRGRLEKDGDLFSPPFTVERYKYNRNSLLNMDSFKFEQFIIEQFGGEPNVKQVGDGGRDGIKRENGVTIPIQVKRRDGVGRPDIQKFVGHLVSANICRGYFIAFSYARSAYEYVAGLKLKQNIEIELVKVDEIVPLSMPPNISLSYEWRNVGEKHDKEISFTAAGDDIEIWQWDWDYRAGGGFRGEVLMDKTGRQSRIFPAGRHEIAVRGVNKEGMSAVETLHLVINGGVREQP